MKINDAIAMLTDYYNINNLEYKKNLIIRPIYISNNELLN